MRTNEEVPAPFYRSRTWFARHGLADSFPVYRDVPLKPAPRTLAERASSTLDALLSVYGNVSFVTRAADLKGQDVADRWWPDELRRSGFTMMPRTIARELDDLRTTLRGMSVDALLAPPGPPEPRPPPDAGDLRAWVAVLADRLCEWPDGQRGLVFTVVAEPEVLAVRIDGYRCDVRAVSTIDSRGRQIVAEAEVVRRIRSGEVKTPDELAALPITIFTTDAPNATPDTTDNEQDPT